MLGAIIGDIVGSSSAAKVAIYLPQWSIPAMILI